MHRPIRCEYNNKDKSNSPNKTKSSLYYSVWENDLWFKITATIGEWRGDMSLKNNSIQAIFFAIVAWNGEHRVFVTEISLKDGDSVTETKLLCHKPFGSGQHENVPDRKTIFWLVGGWVGWVLWHTNFCGLFNANPFFIHIVLFQTIQHEYNLIDKNISISSSSV